jgi:hypothetical protein
MTDDDRVETGKINRLMVKMSAEEAHAIDHVSLKEWVQSYTDNENTQDSIS